MERVVAVGDAQVELSPWADELPNLLHRAKKMEELWLLLALASAVSEGVARVFARKVPWVGVVRGKDPPLDPSDPRD